VPPSIHEALRGHIRQLLDLPHVLGAAVGERGSRPCILVFVGPGAADPPAGLPATLDGYPVIAERTGPFRALGPD
jgi:hypothetical protein